MKLSDLKLADFQNAASQVDLSGTLTRLAIITLLPFVACMVILFARPDSTPSSWSTASRRPSFCWLAALHLWPACGAWKREGLGINPPGRGAFLMPVLRSWRALSPLH
jgi:hypothetical protein